MNPTQLLTTLSFLIFALTTYFPLASTKYVYDTDGYPLAPGYNYHLVQTKTSGQEGGALILGDAIIDIPLEDPKCPLTVLQEFCDENDGLAVTFNISNSGGAFKLIEEDITNVDIVFVNKKPNCAQSYKWLLVTSYVRFHTNWISIGSQEDLDYTEILGSVFNIRKQGNGYKFVFYDKLSRTYFDVKRFNDVNGRRLVANEYDSRKYHPFEVQFVNAKYYDGRFVV